MSEMWKSILNYEGFYQVSNLGRVKSLARKDARGRRVKGKILKTKCRHGCGYQYVDLSKNRTVKSCLIHRLVLEAFVGQCPKGMESCHNNGVKTDNRLNNLRWDTHSNNQLDSVAKETANFSRGNKHSQARLSMEQVLTIRRLYKIRLSNGRRKYTQKQLAAKFSISNQQISMIIKRKRWNHI